MTFKLYILQFTASLLVMLMASYAVVVTFGWWIAAGVYLVWCVANVLQLKLQAERERDFLTHMYPDLQ